MTLRETKHLRTETDARKLPESDAEVTFVGRSNVGKSTLINALCQKKDMAGVSKVPGKTRAINIYEVKPYRWIVDLPGYGFAKVPKVMQNSWQSLISSYLETRQTLKCVVVIMDIRHEPKSEDSQLIDWLKQKSIPCLPVYTKIDKVSGSIREKNAKILDAGHRFSAQERILFCSKTGQGRDKLLDALNEFLMV